MDLDAAFTGPPVKPTYLYMQLSDDIRAVLNRDPSARNFWEVLTCYPGVHAVALYRLAHWLWGQRLRWLARIVSYVGRLLTGIDIHPAAYIGQRLFINNGLGVVIGETSEIGDDVTIFSGVTLGEATKMRGRRHPVLRDGVILETGAKIMGPVVIGERSCIGANAVVTQSVLADSVIGR